jgi:uncharacterized protein
MPSSLQILLLEAVMQTPTQTQVSVPSLPHTPRTALLAFFKKRPLLSAVLIFAGFVLVSAALGLAAKAFLPQVQPEFIVTIALSLLIALALSGLGWWKEAGFNLPREWRDSRLMIVPFLIVLGLPFLKGIKPSDAATFIYLAVGYALTGFMEEGLMRGIVLRVLKPLGTNRSVVISSLLFGLMHIGNLLYRNPFIVLAQMLGSFVDGIGLAGIRLRTNTIWFPIAIHSLHDMVLKYTNFPAIPLDVVQVTLLMLYGIWLLRSWKDPEQGPERM